MSETNAKSQEQKPRTSILALWSFGLAIVSFAIFIGVTILIVSPPLHKRLEWLYFLIPYSTLVFLCSYLIALLLGIGSIYKIRKYKLKGTRLVAWALAINVAILTGIIAVVLLIVRPTIHQMWCGMNMEGIGKALQVYANDFNGKYPTADKWCDLLIQDAEITASSFCCPSAKKGRSHYAINPNCELNSSPDVVLVFETKEGWNQYGGPEILVGDRHRWQGSCVLFNNKDVKFIKKKELAQLKWKSEDSNSVGKSFSK